MSSRKFNFSSSEEVKVDSTYVSARKTRVTIEGNVSVRFDLNDALQLIVENWDEFNPEERHYFARRIEALDRRDTAKLLTKKSESIGASFSSWEWSAPL